MKIVSWSIVNNEIDYLQDILDTHTWLDQMYFLDTGSTDGTWELLQNNASNRIIVEKYPQSFIPQYEKVWDEMDQPFPEVEVRNFALQRAEELTGADWLVQLDGDEIFLPRTKGIIEAQANDILIIGHSTINPVEKLEAHPKENRQTHMVYDPHARIWKSKLGIKYAQNPAFTGQYHCIPIYRERHLYHCPKIKFTHEIIHFHLHWMYGKKVDLFFKNKQIYERSKIIETQCKNPVAHLVPQIFWDRRESWINGK